MNILLMKCSQFQSNFDEILEILLILGLLILTKFDEDWTKIVKLLLLVNFSGSIFFP